MFQHTAARRRLVFSIYPLLFFALVSTHSRPKAAVANGKRGGLAIEVSTHSRPKAAAGAAGKDVMRLMFQHTAARRRLAWGWIKRLSESLFQHTAARRRLRQLHTNRCDQQGFNTQPPEGGCRKRLYRLSFQQVSTHSRPKAAAVSADGI